ncbi:hypothetical protein BDZ94DRAFT_1228616 [Collybia nuda]|uniref:Uncharacterized protein n=1 Tax=Collybia nuda TaxID=64659 RepID=A0A9P6CCE1_9AGAR|nr:hypothetical protein BDZ94DRAFT_1228616 [Collybia nuda]
MATGTHQNQSSSIWTWTGDYLQLGVGFDSNIATHCQCVVQVPGILFHPLAPTIVPVQTDEGRNTATWSIPDAQLKEVLKSAWEELDPKSAEFLGNIGIIPFLEKTSLPYENLAGDKCLYVKDLPQNVNITKKGAEDNIDCYLCEKSLKLKDMRKHVGKHLLLALRDVEDPAPLRPGVVVKDIIDACGWCGRDGCQTHLIKKGSSISITSNCPYHYQKLSYKRALQSSQASPCTNVPIHCPICPPSLTGQPKSFWKYNALYHLASHHLTPEGLFPTVPPQLLVEIYITSKEEASVGICQSKTDEFRDFWDIPDTDGFEIIQENERNKRGRLDSTLVVQRPPKISRS